MGKAVKALLLLVVLASVAVVAQEGVVITYIPWQEQAARARSNFLAQHPGFVPSAKPVKPVRNFRLSWGAITNARYLVYSFPDAKINWRSPDWFLITNTTATSVTVTNDKRQRFLVVRAYRP